MNAVDPSLSVDGLAIIDAAAFEKTRAQLGADFIRLLGYFAEDSVKSVTAIEQGLRAKSAVAMVLPAHTLKTEARQFGAMLLGDISETIEFGARRCVEHQEEPDDLLVPVARLRKLLDATLEVIERETNPLQHKQHGRTHGANQSFGRL